VFFDVYRKLIKRCRGIFGYQLVLTSGIQFIVKPPPLISNELEFCKPQYYGILKARKKHSDEPDRFKIRNITNLSFEIGNRNAKQVPFFWRTSTRCEGSYIRDEVLSHDIELLGTEIHLVLEIFFQ